MENPAIVTPTPAPDKNARTQLLIWMIILQLFALSFITGPVIYLWFELIEGARGTLPLNIETVLFFLLLLNLMPMLAAWLAFARNNLRRMKVLIVLPLALACLEVVVLVVAILGVVPNP